MIDPKLTAALEECPECEGGRKQLFRRELGCRRCRGEGKVLLPVDPKSAAFIAGSHDLRQAIVRALQVNDLWKRDELRLRRLGDRAGADKLEQRRVGLMLGMAAIERILESAWLLEENKPGRLARRR